MHSTFCLAMPSLGETLGAIELGVLFASMLYGVLLVQVYNYYQRNFTDGLSVKILVTGRLLSGILTAV